MGKRGVFGLHAYLCCWSCLESFQILTLVVRQRERIIEDIDAKGNSDDELDLDDLDRRAKPLSPSAEAISKFTDYCEFFLLYRRSILSTAS